MIRISVDPGGTPPGGKLSLTMFVPLLINMFSIGTIAPEVVRMTAVNVAPLVVLMATVTFGPLAFSGPSFGSGETLIAILSSSPRFDR